MAQRFLEKFRPVCRYVMRDKKPQNIKTPENNDRLDDELWRQSGVVYARVCRGRACYIGSTDRMLCKRIREHLTLIGTSKRGRAAQYRKWAEGKRITIVAYKPNPVKLLGRTIAVHRALEAALIVEFRRRKGCFVART
jgi:hypothetical protein